MYMYHWIQKLLSTLDQCIYLYNQFLFSSTCQKMIVDSKYNIKDVCLGYILCILTNQALILKGIFLKDCLSMILLLVFFGNYDYGVAWWQNHSVARSQTVWEICSEYSMYDKNNT